MSVRFSLVYPTRHRPAFVRQALRFLEKQGYQDFEVIVSDNYVDPALSCEAECRNSPLSNLKYVHPPRPVGMVENWNYALQFASGDYICYFTDKMFLLPDTLSIANKCIEKSHAEIVNWVDSAYHPKLFPDYFGQGFYYPEVVHSVPQGMEFSAYDPQEELSKKGCALVARSEQDKSTYVRGKICFGAYSSELCNRIVRRTGALFHNVAPDYTSMILGLSMARSGIEIEQPGIVHVMTDLSNGGQIAIHDELTLKFLSDLGNVDDILNDFLVPGLYCSQHNVVTHDYLALKKKYQLAFQFDTLNWLVHIAEDLDVSGREWSSKEIEIQQRGSLQSFIENLSPRDQKMYQMRCRERKKLAERALTKKTRARERQLAVQLAIQQARDFTKGFRKFMRMLLPEIVTRKLSNWLLDAQRSEPLPDGPSPNYCSSIEDILK